MAHFYPQEFAEHIHRRLASEPEQFNPDLRPERDVLAQLVSTLYQASLMREEGRQSRFRLILRNPEAFPAGQAPPEGLHRLVFDATRPCSEDELRRLFPATGFHRTMIGASFDEDSRPRIWGIVHTGYRWLEVISGGTRKIAPLPNSLIFFVTGPGQITVTVGSTFIAALRGGRLITPGGEVFTAPWFHDIFAVHRDELRELHLKARRGNGKLWARLDPEFCVDLGQNLMRRIVSIVRRYRHGGIILIVPTSRTEELKSVNPYFTIKYTFTVDEGRTRIHPHMARIMNEFARVAGESRSGRSPVGWSDYLDITDPLLSDLDESLFEMANFLAEMTLVDGAVVLNQRFEVLGFGAEISGGLESVPFVERALDIDGTMREPESVKGVGTRHRSAYRLCNALRDSLAIVTSQDGHVRFIRWHDGAVTCWDQVATSIFDF